MTEILAIAIATQIVFVLGGYGLMQLWVWDRCLRFWTFLPFYWGVGTVLLYLAGSFLVRVGLLVQSWHWLIVLVCAVLFTLALWRRNRSEQGQDESEYSASTQSTRWGWLDYSLVSLIVAKVILVGFIAVHNPVIDTDATYVNYVPMAHKIGGGIKRADVIEEDVRWGKRNSGSLAPVVLSAYPRLFLDRWHNHATSIPWLFCYLSIFGAIFFFSRRLTGRLTLSLVITYFFSALPLVANHTIQPGLNDLLVCHFLILGFGAVAVLIKSENLKASLLQRNWTTALVLSGTIGAFLSKPEGMLWSFWLIVILASYALNAYKNFAWTKIIGTQVLLASVGILVWFAFGDEWFVQAGGRIGQLAPAGFDLQAWSKTIDFLFVQGTFNVLWWAAVISALLVLIYGTANDRLLIFYLLTVIMFLIFFMNFTKNSVYTVQGTTPGRFLQHVLAVPLLIMLSAIDILQKKNLLR